MAGLWKLSGTAAVWLVLRLWLGYEWLVAGIDKAFGPGSDVWVGAQAGAAVNGYLNGALAKAQFDAVKNPHPEVHQWYADFINGIALPNATYFSYLVAYGEILVGGALLLGLATHFAVLMGLVMNFAYLFAGTSSSNPEMVLIGLPLVLLAGRAAGYYGLDYYLYPAAGQFWQLVRDRWGDTPSDRQAPHPGTS